ncbi:hypothetical protein [Dellaglioa algida]|uniref:hypothetical protein n=1 Tax=Dellaglioa algida TaxID=105612 RepID=UPI0024C4C477|nr:hypothetical protein [Dellaglioa algida]MDK1727616.1 hypothetical protein [Dellaglioa algida]MDK1735258.1 hypothetical protein [Dellaglioa algida]MDK1736938.1 hypothetical protein [Dellaglioa algida]
MKKVLNITSAWYLAVGVAVGIVLPMLLTLANANDVVKIGVSLFVVNVIYAIAVGVVVGKSNHSLIFVFFFPIIFAIGVLFHLFQSVMILFALIYLCLSLLTWGISKN